MGLAEAGMEVIYTGMYQKPEQVVATAIQEDVDILGVSTLSGGHMGTFQDIIGLLKKDGRQDDILLIGGGIIPAKDIEALKMLGVAEIFRPGCHIADIVRFIEGKFGGANKETGAAG